MYKNRNLFITPHPKLPKKSFDLSSRRGVIGNPKAKPRGILFD